MPPNTPPPSRIDRRLQPGARHVRDRARRGGAHERGGDGNDRRHTHPSPALAHARDSIRCRLRCDGRPERLFGDSIGRIGRAAEQPPRQLRTAEEQRRVVLPRRADPAVDVDHQPPREVEGVARGLAEALPLLCEPRVSDVVVRATPG